MNLKIVPLITKHLRFSGSRAPCSSKRNRPLPMNLHWSATLLGRFGRAIRFGRTERAELLECAATLGALDSGPGVRTGAPSQSGAQHRTPRRWPAFGRSKRARNRVALYSSWRSQVWCCLPRSRTTPPKTAKASANTLAIASGSGTATTVFLSRELAGVGSGHAKGTTP
jgi:hypothetical protein